MESEEGVRTIHLAVVTNMQMTGINQNAKLSTSHVQNQTEEDVQVSS